MNFKQFVFSLVFLLSPAVGSSAPDAATFSAEKDSRVLLFEHSVVWPSGGMPHEVKAYFKQVEVLPTATTKVNLVPSRAKRHLATFAQPKSHANFLKTPYFYKVFDEIMQVTQRFQSTKNLKTTFSVLFERAQPEDSVVTVFDFEKKNNKLMCNVTVNALSEGVDAELVNLILSLICDDSFASKHWGKGLFGISALLTSIFRKELPLGIGKKFQSFYEQAEREVARVYPGVFDKWQPFVGGAKFAKKKDDPSYAIILVANKDNRAFRFMGPLQIKAKLNGVMKIAIVTEGDVLEFQHTIAIDFCRNANAANLCFPFRLTFVVRNLGVPEAGNAASLVNLPLNFHQEYEVALNVREQFINLLMPFLSLNHWKMGKMAVPALMVHENIISTIVPKVSICVSSEGKQAFIPPAQNGPSTLEVCFEVAPREISADETRRSSVDVGTGRMVRQCFYQKIIVCKSTLQDQFKLFANGVMQEFVRLDDLIREISAIANALRAETKEVDLLTQKFEDHPNLPEIFQEEMLNKCNDDGARDWIAESPGTVGWHLRRDGSTETLISMRSVLASELNPYEPWNYIYVSFEKEIRDIPGEETQPRARKLIQSTKSVTVYDQKIVVYRNAENKLVLVAGGASEVVENIDDLWTKIKEIALARHAEQKEEDLFTAMFGELSETPDRPKAFDELYKTRRPGDGLLEQDIVLLSDEEFAALERDAAGKIKVIGHDGAEKNITEAEAQKLREAGLKLKQFVGRMKKTNDAEAVHARTLVLEPKADGDAWEKVAHIISECDLLSVDEFKKKEASARRIFDLKMSGKERAELMEPVGKSLAGDFSGISFGPSKFDNQKRDLLDALYVLSTQFIEKIKVAIPGSIVIYSRERFCYNVRLKIGEDSFSIVVANPYAYVLKRSAKDRDNLSTRQITRAALVADFINTDSQCTEYGFSAPEMKLCLRKGATKEGFMDDRFLIAIDKIESVPAVGGAGVCAAPAMFTVQQLCKIAEIMERAGSIAWDDRSLVSIPPVEGSDSIGSHRFMNLIARKGFFFQKHKCPELKPYMLLDRIPDGLWTDTFEKIVDSCRVGARRIKLFSKIYPSELDDFLFDRVALLLDNPWTQLRESGLKRESAIKRQFQTECFKRRLLRDYLATLKERRLLDEDQANRIQDFWFREDGVRFLSLKLRSPAFLARKRYFASIPIGTRVERILGQEGYIEDDEWWQKLFDYERDVFNPSYEAALMGKEDTLSRFSFVAGEDAAVGGSV
jgi:hypothetical protein